MNIVDALAELHPHSVYYTIKMKRTKKDFYDTFRHISFFPFSAASILSGSHFSKRYALGLCVCVYVWQEHFLWQ